MFRKGIVFVHLPAKRYKALDNNTKRKYNRVVATNQTIKSAYYCPKGRQHCSFCSCPDKSGKRRRLDRNNYLRDFIKNDS